MQRIPEKCNTKRNPLFHRSNKKKKTDGIVHQISCYYFFFSNKRERTLIGESVHTLLDFTREKKREKNKEEKLSKLMFHSPSSPPQKKKKNQKKRCSPCVIILRNITVLICRIWCPLQVLLINQRFNALLNEANRRREPSFRLTQNFLN